VSNPDSLQRKATVIQNWRTRPPGASIYVNTQGLKEYAWYLAFGIKTVQKNLIALHAQKLGRWEQYAKNLLESDARRPQERGWRAEGSVPGKGRQTDKFTFGRGGSLRGVLPAPEDSGNRMIMGFPDIPHADASTRGAWRALEVGAIGRKVHPQARLGLPPPIHKMPVRFYFVEGKLQPLSRGSVSRLHGFAKVGLSQLSYGPGFTGRHFIEESSKLMEREIVRDYERIYRSAWK
jgi:hypothetical protein